MLRKVLLTVVGHVDHGKSSILDTIRGSAVAEREAGLITQAIGASIIPLETINRVCQKLMAATGQKFTVPGLLAIDTPGHAAFSNLRKRGGSLADIAIVVIDIREGFKPQTIESIEILKASKTPFIIAANKIDLLPHWQSKPDTPVLANIQQQNPQTLTAVETKLYEIVGQVHEHFQLNADRFDRISDYTQQIGIVPVSAKTKEGIPELLMVVMGLAQKFLEQNLQADKEGSAKGTVLEVKEDKGLGTTLDVIIYDGKIKVNDPLIIGGIDGPIVTKVKALFEPAPLGEMREKRTKFKSTKEVEAATGVKISAKDIQDVIGGMPLEAGVQDIEAAKERVQEQVDEVTIETEDEGIIIKADALGSLEALTTLLQEKNIPIRKAMIGDITRKDVIDAQSNVEKDPLLGVILGFNAKLPSDIDPQNVKVITADIIYKIIEDLEEWQNEKKKSLEAKGLDELTRPFKMEILRGYVFRQSNPAVFGVEVTHGTARNNVQVMRKDLKVLAAIKGLQAEQEHLEKAERGKQVAVSLPHVTMGRQLNEGDILYSHIPEDHFRKLKDFKQHLSEDEKEVLREIAELRRKENPLWGI